LRKENANFVINYRALLAPTAWSRVPQTRATPVRRAR
jgi:hypothetical protein